MTRYIMPLLIITIVIIGLVKRINIYNSFVGGAKSALELVLKIFPYIMSIMVLISLMRASHADRLLEWLLSPIFSFFGIPKELAPLVIVRPLSGNGSIAMLEDIIRQYGVDSYIAKCAAIIVGASETVFYISVLYFSTSKVKNTRYLIPVALVASFVGVIVACLLARYM